MRTDCPAEPILNLIRGLNRMGGKKTGTPIYRLNIRLITGGRRNNCRQPCREGREIDVVDAKRGGGIVTKVGLRGKRISSSIAGDELIHERGRENVRLVKRQTRGAQRCILPSGNERTKIVFAGRAGGSLVAAATLSLGIEKIESFIA